MVRLISNAIDDSQLLRLFMQQNPTIGLYFASSGHVRLVKEMLDAGADPNGTDAFVPLFAAANWGSPEIVTLLLESGADPHKRLIKEKKVKKSILRSLVDKGFDTALDEGMGLLKKKMAEEDPAWAKHHASMAEDSSVETPTAEKPPDRLSAVYHAVADTNLFRPFSAAVPRYAARHRRANEEWGVVESTRRKSPPVRSARERGKTSRILVEAQRNEVLVPGGRFWMGLTPAGQEWIDNLSLLSEANATVVKQAVLPHEVDVDSFFIDTNEVTVEQFNAYSFANGADLIPSGSTADFPVLVNWEDADGYCNWLGARLPSEAEWERSARGDDGRLFPWGTPDTSEDGWEKQLTEYHDLSGLSSVGSHPKGQSPYGVADMAGNAREWVDDWFDKEHVPPLLERTGGEKKTVKGVSVFPFAMAAWREGVGMDELAGFRCARSWRSSH